MCILRACPSQSGPNNMKSHRRRLLCFWITCKLPEFWKTRNGGLLTFACRGGRASNQTPRARAPLPGKAKGLRQNHRLERRTVPKSSTRIRLAGWGIRGYRVVRIQIPRDAVDNLHYSINGRFEELCDLRSVRSNKKNSSCGIGRERT